MSVQPSAPDSVGRDRASGRFVTGNTFSRGNPHALAVNRLRARLLEAVTEDDLHVVVRNLIEQAKAGDLAAIKELLDRLLGRPTQAVNIHEDRPREGTSVMLARLLADVRAAQTRLGATPAGEPRDVTPEDKLSTDRQGPGIPM